MDIRNHEILASDYEGKDIMGLPNSVAGDAENVKARFDALVKDVVAPKYNALINELADYFDILDPDGSGVAANAKNAESADFANEAAGLASSLIHTEKSITPAATSAVDVSSFELEPGTYIFIITVTWSKINTATKLIVRNSQNKVPSKAYGYFPVSNITPGLQSVDVFTLASKTTVSSQIWPEDSTSLKAYTVHTKIFKIA